MTTWIAVLLVGAGSYAFRALPLFSGWPAAPPPSVERILSHAGTASITALAAVGIRHQTVDADPSGATATVLALGAGVAVASRRAPMPVVVGVGVATHLLVGIVTARL